MAEKQKTLRPEIQLLNNLIAATDAAQRDEVCFARTFWYCLSTAPVQN